MTEDIYSADRTANGVLGKNRATEQSSTRTVTIPKSTQKVTSGPNFNNKGHIFDVTALPGDREAIIILDTISTLSIYNDEEVIIEFLEGHKKMSGGCLLSSHRCRDQMDEQLEEDMKDSVETKYDLNRQIKKWFSNRFSHKIHCQN